MPLSASRHRSARCLALLPSGNPTHPKGTADQRMNSAARESIPCSDVTCWRPGYAVVWFAVFTGPARAGFCQE